MIIRVKSACLTALALGLSLGAGLLAPVTRAAPAPDLDTLRRLGKAYYENDDFKAAAAQYRQCLARQPESAADHFNLGLVLMRANDLTNALAELAEAERRDPELLAPVYLRGIIYKRQGEFARAIECLAQVVRKDPQCVGAYYNLGVCHKQLGQDRQAIAAFLAALKTDPHNPNCHYQLITLYRRLGEVENAARHREAYDRFKDILDASEKTVEALERSRYSYLIEAPAARLPTAGAGQAVPFADVTTAAGLRPVERPSKLPPHSFQNLVRNKYDAARVAREFVPRFGGSVALGDYDSDGDLDIYVVNCHAQTNASRNRLYRNAGHLQFTDVTAVAGVGDAHWGTHAVFGDYDNDGHPDLYVVNDGPNVLYHNRGDGTFEDVSTAAHVNEPQFGSRAAFVDYDHDNDLDLLVVNNVDLADVPDRATLNLPADGAGQVNALLRNNGNGTFLDQTDEAGLLIELAQSRDLAFADFDGDHDVDLFTANHDAPSPLFLNARLGRLAPGGTFDPALDRGAEAVAEADFNRDGHPDLAVLVQGRLLIYTNDGRANFKAGQPVAESSTANPTSKPVGSDRPRILALDFNNDGWTDLLLTAGRKGSLQLLAGIGPADFQDVTTACSLDRIAADGADFAAGDLDGDGDLDLVLQTRDLGPVVLRNDSKPVPHWLAVRLAGRKVNRQGRGATIEVAGTGYYQRQTVREGLTHFGLGGLTSVDVVRVTWPNGVAQNVIQPTADRVLDIEEYVKVSASCAFLWADDGQGFKLVNEILGIGPLGVPMTPDQCFPLDCTELTKIEPGQLVARDGWFELRLTEDLREVCYLDQAELRVVDHPADLEIIPNEMFTGPPFPEDKFYAVARVRPPRAAVDDRGRDVLELVRARDGRYPTFPLTAYDGLAEPHHLTLEFGPLDNAGRVMLFLDSWIYWPDSSVSAAIFQDPRYAITPLRLERRDGRGRWQTLIDSVGLPTSKGLVVPVDLTGKLDEPDCTLRLSTTMCVYFDRIFIATENRAAQCRVRHLPVASADLYFRGFSPLHRDALGYERFDYADVSPVGSWSPPKGNLTRYGDVTPLLDAPDDCYVIFGPGDELSLRFDARNLPALPAGWQRSFVFYANGWVKDGDLNTLTSETIEPLPFHGMSQYPYPATEHYPDTPKHRAYRAAYNTRPSQNRTGELVRNNP